jgi:putative DNA-binding protein
MKDHSLNNVQRWMQSVITHPAGVAAGLAAPAAQSHIELPPDAVEQIIEPSLRQSSVERLAVYADAYCTRLIECLQAEFPVFRQTVGDDVFSGFAADYLQHYPSHSYTLSRLGINFVRYLNETKPAISEASSDFSEFLIDLAQLERTISEVFDGPGCEESTPLRTEDLCAIDLDAWPRARLQTAPCLCLLALRFPLNDYYTAAKNGVEETPLPARENSWLAITRRDYIVRRYPLSHAQFLLLDNLQRGQTIGHAITAAADIYSSPPNALVADIQNWFRTWTAAPMFQSVISD